MVAPDKDQRVRIDATSDGASSEQERKLFLVRGIFAEMSDEEFRAFLTEFTFAFQLHCYARERIKDLFAGGNVPKGRQDPLLDLLGGHMKSAKLMSESLLNEEVAAQVRARGFDSSSIDSKELKQIGRDLIDGDSSYSVSGLAYSAAAILGRQSMHRAQIVLDDYEIQGTFVTPRQDPVDLFLERWGQQASPSTVAPQE